MAGELNQRMACPAQTALYGDFFYYYVKCKYSVRLHPRYGDTLPCKIHVRDRRREGREYIYGTASIIDMMTP